MRQGTALRRASPPGRPGVALGRLHGDGSRASQRAGDRRAPAPHFQRHAAQAPRRRSPARCLSTSRAAHRAARSRCDRANASFAASVRRRSCSRARSSRASSAAAERSRAAASCSAIERSRLRAACVASIFCRRVGGAGGSSS